MHCEEGAAETSFLLYVIPFRLCFVTRTIINTKSGIKKSNFFQKNWGVSDQDMKLNTHEQQMCYNSVTPRLWFVVQTVKMLNTHLVHHIY